MRYAIPNDDAGGGQADSARILADQNVFDHRKVGTNWFVQAHKDLTNLPLALTEGITDRSAHLALRRTLQTQTETRLDDINLLIGVHFTTTARYFVFMTPSDAHPDRCFQDKRHERICRHRRGSLPIVGAEWGAMNEVELVEQVRRRWEQGVPPKVIARALGVRPSVVAPLVRKIAAEAEASRGVGRVLGCWVNCGWSAGLGLEGHPDWAALDAPANEAEGFAQVFLAREGRRGRATLRGYLADVYCLGVKNATDPETMDAGNLARAIRSYYASFDRPPLEIPIELGRELILGAVHYSRGLGFEPVAAFDDDAAAFLGEWDGPARIEFGRDGQPFYLNGPYDNPAAVIRTLKRSVGSGDFQFSVAAGPI